MDLLFYSQDMKRIFFLAFAGLLSVACNNNQLPADLLPADKMVDFLSEAYLLEGFYAVETEYRYDAMTPEVARAYDDILAKHGVSIEAVEHSFEYYSKHPDQYLPIQDSVIARLERDMSPSDLTTPSDIHIDLQ